MTIGHARRVAATAWLVLILGLVPATSARADGGATCNRWGQCDATDTSPGKPGDSGPDKSKSGDNLDKAPALPDCSSFPKATDVAPDKPDGWVQIGCEEGGVPVTLWVRGGTNPAQIARSLLARIQLKPIEIGLVPRGANAMTVVGMPVWLWVNDPTATTWGPATISAGGVTLTARVQSVIWDLGDGTTLTCGQGTEWTRGMGAAQSPTCGHTYDEQGTYTIRARSHWVATWSGYGQSGTIPVTLSASRQLDVGEIQVIETDG